jgi:hypothetical protein
MWAVAPKEKKLLQLCASQHKNSVTWRPKTGIMKSEETSIVRNCSVNTFPQHRIRKQQSITSVAMQWCCKHAFWTIERLCFLRGPCRWLIKGTKNIVWVSWDSRHQPTRIWAWEQRKRINSSSVVHSCSRELRESAVEGDWKGMARKKLDCAK